MFTNSYVDENLNSHFECRSKLLLIFHKEHDIMFVPVINITQCGLAISTLEH